MAIEASYCKYRKDNLKIGIVICIIAVIWFVYDGYFNEKWINEHTNADGSPQTYLVFNRKAPVYFGAAVVILTGLLLAVKNKKIIAAENELIISGKRKIPYDSIEKIDKTHFDSKGYFIITYLDENNGKTKCKISHKKYDNLKLLLDELVAKIS